MGRDRKSISSGPYHMIVVCWHQSCIGITAIHFAPSQAQRSESGLDVASLIQWERKVPYAIQVQMYSTTIDRAHYLLTYYYFDAIIIIHHPLWSPSTRQDISSTQQPKHISSSAPNSERCAMLESCLLYIVSPYRSSVFVWLIYSIRV